MTKYRMSKHGTYLLKNDRKLYNWANESDEIADLLNKIDEKYIDEFSLRETLQQDLQRVEKENEQLKSELKGMEELLKSYRKTIKHDAGLFADATKKGYLPPLEDWKSGAE